MLSVMLPERMRVMRVMRVIRVPVFVVSLLASLPYVASAQRPVNFSFGGGYTQPNAEVSDRLGGGYNFNIGLQGNVTPVIGIEGLYSFNGFGDKQLLIDIASAPGGTPIPTELFGDMSMQYGTASLIVQKPDGGVRPYGLVGMGVYYRKVRLTTPGVGFVPGYCDPWWYVCYPGGWVETTNIIGDRSSTDFGMSFGGGVNFGAFYGELRYHYVWGPEVQATSGYAAYRRCRPRHSKGQRPVPPDDVRLPLLDRSAIAFAAATLLPAAAMPRSSGAAWAPPRPAGRDEGFPSSMLSGSLTRASVRHGSG